jgi:hypothetical protein
MPLNSEWLLRGCNKGEALPQGVRKKCAVNHFTLWWTYSFEDANFAILSLSWNTLFHPAVSTLVHLTHRTPLLAMYIIIITGRPPRQMSADAATWLE